MLMKWLRKHRYTIFLVTVVGFLVGSFMGFGSYFFTRSPYDAAIEVNGTKISYKRYQMRHRQYLEQARQNGGTLDKAKLDEVKRNTLQDLVREAVFLAEADRYGITVTDQELAAYLARVPAFQKDGRFDQATYFQVLGQVIGMPPEEFELDRRNDIRIQKMQALMASAVKITDPEFQWHWQRETARLKGKELAELQQNPGALREQLRQEQVTNVFQEWLGQVNTNLKVQVHLEQFEGKQSS